ncbi:MAG: hypothetical protein ACO4BZ_06045 [Ilumatobacteraceae bacterium]
MIRRLLTAAGIVLVAVSGVTLVRSGASTVVDAASFGDLGAGGEFHALSPARVVDTRQWATAPRMDPEGRSFSVDIVGLGGLPAPIDDDGDGLDDRVLAVAMTVTVVDPSADGFLSMRGVGAARGESSLVNFVAHDDVPNSAIIRPGVGGAVEVTLTAPWVRRGSADVLIDVFGWFSTSVHTERGARLVPTQPFRLIDTRRVESPLGPDSILKVDVRGRGPVPVGSEVIGLVANLTAVNDLVTSEDTYLSVLPSVPSSGPTTSNVNLRAGATRPVSVIVPLAEDGSVSVFNRSGEVHVLIDVMGYLVTGAQSSSRAGRVVPLVSPVRILDTRQESHGEQPAGPGVIEAWSMDRFVERVAVNGSWIGPQSAVIGNLTATGLRQESAIAVGSTFVTVSPAGGSLPDASILNVVPGRDVANMALVTFGATSEADRAVVFRNAFGYVDLVLDAAAVVLDEWPEPTTSSTSTTTSTTSTTSTSTTSTTTSSTTTSTSVSPATSATSTPITVSPAGGR